MPSSRPPIISAPFIFDLVGIVVIRCYGSSVIALATQNLVRRGRNRTGLVYGILLIQALFFLMLWFACGRAIVDGRTIILVFRNGCCKGIPTV